MFLGESAARLCSDLEEAWSGGAGVVDASDRDSRRYRVANDPD